jgi:hypothetical protein
VTCETIITIKKLPFLNLNNTERDGRNYFGFFIKAFAHFYIRDIVIATKPKAEEAIRERFFGGVRFPVNAERKRAISAG